MAVCNLAYGVDQFMRRAVFKEISVRLALNRLQDKIIFGESSGDQAFNMRRCEFEITDDGRMAI